MRVAIVHSYYSSSQPSGENIVVDAQADALRRAGHDVVVISRYSDEMLRERTIRSSISLAISVASGKGADPTDELNAFGPDVVHIHNLFPNWGKEWVKSWPGPIVVTLHNFRSSCAAGTFYRDGHECTECIDSTSFQAIAHRCYRDSVLATVPLAIATRGGAASDLLVTAAERVIALSARASALHVLAGVPASKIEVLPNFVVDSSMTASSNPTGPWKYVGRLAPEKGVKELVVEWPDDIDLEIVGDGPLLQELISLAPSNISFVGKIPRSEIPNVLNNARGLIFPSRWAEGAVPLSYVEALSMALPVIAWHGSGAADDIIEGGAGEVVSDWSNIGQVIARVDANRASYANRARARFEDLYSETTWVKEIGELYGTVVQRFGRMK